MNVIKERFYLPYAVFLGVLFFFVTYALYQDSPQAIAEGLVRIHLSRSNLITDYAAVGGLGAMLVNAAIVGLFALASLMILDIEPTGGTIMALWLSLGFACFGKNLFNTLPLSCGVWLYAKVHGEPFRNYVLTSLLSATLSPVVSEVSFWGIGFAGAITLGVALGIFCGFIFPVVSEYVIRVHGGYDLYSMGFAGGVIAMFIACAAKSVGVEFEPTLLWATEYKTQVTFMLCAVSVYLILIGVLYSNGVESLFESLKNLYTQSGRLPSDFYSEFGATVYFNMGLMGLLFTIAMLALGADLNGATAGGIFTIIGFGAFGKHLKNTVPVLVGAVLSSYVNMWIPNAPLNVLAILFSTGLAPIAGQFGWLWGGVAGFLHVNIVHYSGTLNNGLNLYNNGFAAGFVAMFLLPLILTVRKER